MLFSAYVILFLAVLGVECGCPSRCRCTLGEASCSSQNTLPISGFNSKIRRLDLSYNDITEISEFGIRRLYFNALICLNISHNAIKIINKNSFMDQSALETLDLSWNKLEYLPNSTFLYTKRLKWLSLAHNQLSIPISDKFLLSPSLRILHLEGCGFDHISLSSFNRLANLQELYLSQNKIKFLISEELLKTLSRLDISHNHLDRFPNLSASLPGLQQLNITFNKLHNLSEVFQDGQNTISRIAIENNPWNCPCGTCDINSLCLKFNTHVDICENVDSTCNESQSTKFEEEQQTNSTFVLLCLATISIILGTIVIVLIACLYWEYRKRMRPGCSVYKIEQGSRPILETETR